MFNILSGEYGQLLNGTRLLKKCTGVQLLRVCLNQFNMRLENKVVIVTGSTTGIGKAIALRCISEGAKVVIHGLEKDLGRAIMSQLNNDNAVLQIEDLTNSGAPER